MIQILDPILRMKPVGEEARKAGNNEDSFEPVPGSFKRQVFTIGFHICDKKVDSMLEFDKFSN